MGNSVSSLLVLNFNFWDLLKTNKKNYFKKSSNINVFCRYSYILTNTFS